MVTTTDLIKLAINKKKKKKEEEQEYKSYNLPSEAPPEADKGKPGKAEQFVDVETGIQRGVTLPDGRTFFGVNKEDIALLEQQQGLKPGALGMEAERERLKRAALLGNIGQLTPEQILLAQQRALEFVRPGFLPGNINLGQAATAGLAEAGTGAVAGAATGALTGAAAGAGVGAIPGALAGAAIGTFGAFIKGSYSDIKQQQSGLVKAEAANVRSAITQLNNIISAVNQGADPDEALVTYNQVVADVYQSWSELKLQTIGNAKAFEDGTVELERFEIFFRPEGTLDSIDLKMAQAVVNPNPSKVSAASVEDFLGENDET